MNYRTEAWIDDASSLEYSEYWNDVEIEARKIWNVEGESGFDGMQQHLDSTGLSADLSRCLEVWEGTSGRGLGPRGADLAAGSCWTAGVLSTRAGVEHVTYLDFSRHRIHRLAPKVLHHYEVPESAATLVWGSFYDIRLPDASLDFVVLATALHHASDAQQLLAEVRRVLKRDGVVLVVGEHRVSLPALYAKNAVKWLVGWVPDAIQRAVLGRTVESVSLFPSRATLLAPDPVLGDHYYTDEDYAEMFRNGGWRVTDASRAGSEFRSFLLMPS